MKILSINTFNIGSTGNIMLNVADKAKTVGIKTVVCCPKSRDNSRRVVESQILIGDRISRNAHIKLSQITGREGCFSYFATKKLLRQIDEYAPDIIHLHNIHGWYINIPLLFKYIKKKNIKTVWTLHDCWSFTGHCPHFVMQKCDKWETGCYGCPRYRQYPQSYVDNSKYMYKLKKKWFTGVNDMTIVTPSEWLAKLVKRSYLKDYPVKVINNGINLGVFKPTESDFRQKYGCQDKKILLGVAFDWGIAKGLDVFVELSKRLPSDYQIVLVGTNDAVKAQLPDNIIAINRTQDQAELAGIYTSADVFVNATREEVLGLVNIEANACGTPVVTFRTGGSPECIDETSGSVVDCDDVDALEKEIIRICELHPYSEEACLERARSFHMNDRFKEYVDLYENLK